MTDKQKEWLVATGKRALHTMAQTAGGFITVGMCISEVNWGLMASVSLVAGVVSVIKSIAVGVPEVPGTVKDIMEDGK